MNKYRPVSSTGRALDCESGDQGSIPGQFGSLPLWLILSMDILIVPLSCRSNLKLFVKVKATSKGNLLHSLRVECAVAELWSGEFIVTLLWSGGDGKLPPPPLSSLL